MTKRTCSIESCEDKHVARGYCEKHYRAAKHRGEFQVTQWASDADRFWSKVNKGEGCWDWGGARRGPGYGAFRIGGRLDGKIIPAHRFSYELVNGPIPDGLVIDHICRNPSCVRPDHLRACTQQHNVEYRRGANRNNRSSGVRNVQSSGSKSKPWKVVIRHDRKHLNFGTYATIEEAEAVAIRERAKLHTF